MSFFYLDQTILLTSMHKKEEALTSSAKKILGAHIRSTRDAIDTDMLGTFSGEKERIKSQKETALEKCKLGMEKEGCLLGIASEGSFGPYLGLPFIYSSYETLVFVDEKLDLVIYENAIYKMTNFLAIECDKSTDLSEFLKKSLFPSHGLVVKPIEPLLENAPIIKGIQNIQNLNNAIQQCSCQSESGKIIVETDMRAHMNPTRMANIRKLGIKLFRRLSKSCPHCNTPGWGKTGIKRGRLCLACHSPTDLVSSYVYSCVKCHFQVEKPLSSVVGLAPPSCCNFCNP